MVVPEIHRYARHHGLAQDHLKDPLDGHLSVLWYDLAHDFSSIQQSHSEDAQTDLKTYESGGNDVLPKDKLHLTVGECRAVARIISKPMTSLVTDPNEFWSNILQDSRRKTIQKIAPPLLVAGDDGTGKDIAPRRGRLDLVTVFESIERHGTIKAQHFANRQLETGQWLGYIEQACEDTRKEIHQKMKFSTSVLTSIALLINQHTRHRSVMDLYWEAFEWRPNPANIIPSVSLSVDDFADDHDDAVTRVPNRTASVACQTIDTAEPPSRLDSRLQRLDPPCSAAGRSAWSEYKSSCASVSSHIPSMTNDQSATRPFGRKRLRSRETSIDIVDTARTQGKRQVHSSSLVSTKSTVPQSVELDKLAQCLTDKDGRNAEHKPIQHIWNTSDLDTLRSVGPNSSMCSEVSNTTGAETPDDSRMMNTGNRATTHTSTKIDINQCLRAAPGLADCRLQMDDVLDEWLNGHQNNVACDNSSNAPMSLPPLGDLSSAVQFEDVIVTRSGLSDQIQTMPERSICSSQLLWMPSEFDILRSWSPAGSILSVGDEPESGHEKHEGMKTRGNATNTEDTHGSCVGVEDDSAMTQRQALPVADHETTSTAKFDFDQARSDPAPSYLSTFLELRGIVKPETAARPDNTAMRNECVMQKSSYDPMSSSPQHDAGRKIEVTSTCDTTPAVAVIACKDSALGTRFTSTTLVQSQTIMVSSTLLQTRPDTTAFLESQSEFGLEIVYCDAQSQMEVMPDLTVSPTTCIVYTSLQSVSQKLLPGQSMFRNATSLYQALFNLSLKFSSIFVLVTGCVDETLGSLSTTANAVAQFTSFCLSVKTTERESHIQPIYLASQTGENPRKEISGWTWSIIMNESRLGVTESQKPFFAASDMPAVQELTLWEQFLRRAGLNPMAAQVALGALESSNSASELAPCDFDKPLRMRYGLGDFVQMRDCDRSRELERFGGGRAVGLINQVLSISHTVPDEERHAIGHASNRVRIFGCTSSVC